MLFLDIKKHCNNIGIEDPKRWLVKNGFTHVDAARLVDHTQASITYVKLEKLCLLLNCTPTELLSWQPKDNSTVAPTHPLQKLKAVPKQASISAKLRALPPEKMGDLQRYLDELAGK
ncbi:helix-turn-helix domain-containing protein [Ferruginibacter albus]|uniref:helix-turn-helix domain-containing protein n=1 Tax=Ferruginibacter albus TaxID=2875540 RepID=UPI001CC68450|nr:helix-turn-helix domain-containing protein [Ferruginibacter albus]UAY50661.1 helix-turn-helix transcriptional regulator [Ferruginibacter albus]